MDAPGRSTRNRWSPKCSVEKKAPTGHATCLQQISKTRGTGRIAESAKPQWTFSMCPMQLCHLNFAARHKRSRRRPDHMCRQPGHGQLCKTPPATFGRGHGVDNAACLWRGFRKSQPKPSCIFATTFNPLLGPASYLARWRKAHREQRSTLREAVHYICMDVFATCGGSS